MELIFVIDTLSIMLHCTKSGAIFPIWMRLYLMPLVLRIDLVSQYDGWVANKNITGLIKNRKKKL